MNLKSNYYRLYLCENGTMNEDDYNNNDYEQINFKNVKENLKLTLKEHQKKSLNSMITLEKGDIKIKDNILLNSKIGILGDCVGSGKSLTILALISSNKNTYISKNISSYGCNNIQILSTHDGIIKNTTLIVVPHSLVKQWEDYIKQYTKYEYIKINNKKSYDAYEATKNYDIILISSTLYNEFIFNFNNKNIQWNRVVFDEADTINIPSCSYPKTNFTWFITSTIQNLLFVNGYYYITSEQARFPRYKRIYLNGVKKNGYIKETCKNITPECDVILPYIIIKNKNEFIKKSFDIHEPNVNYIHCKNLAILSILDGVVNNEILSRLNAGDTDGALEMLDCNINTKKNIIEHVTSDIQTKINNLNQELNFLNSLTYSRSYDIEQNNKKKEQVIKDIDRHNDNLNNIKLRIDKFEDNFCPICIDTLETPICCLSCCKNLFCMKCITLALQRKEECPLCRSYVTNDSINVIHEKSVKNINNRPSKTDVLLKIVKEEKSKKILIFSSYENTFNIIETILNNNNISYSKLSGNYNHINYKLNLYKNGSLNILLLNSQNFGTGLNLEKTTDIIFYHKMNKDLEQQVIGRAQRFGRENVLNIHMLCYDNELPIS